MGDTKAYKKGAMEPGLTTGIRFLYRQTWPCFFMDKVLLNKNYKCVRWLFWRRDIIIEFPFLLTSFSPRTPLHLFSKCHLLSVQFLVMI